MLKQITRMRKLTFCVAFTECIREEYNIEHVALLMSIVPCTDLNLGGQSKEMQSLLITGGVCIMKMRFPKPIGKSIGGIGAKSLSESLKSNTTLTELNLSSEYKKKEDTKDIHQQSTLFHSLHVNREHYWRHRSRIIE